MEAAQLIQARISKFEKRENTVFYKIVIRTEGKKWRVERRYNEFKELQIQLKKNYGNITEIPGKTLFSLNSYDVLDLRKKKLEKFVQSIVGREDLRGCDLFMQFFELKNNMPELAKENLSLEFQLETRFLGFRDIVFPKKSGDTFLGVSGEMEITQRLLSGIRNISLKNPISLTKTLTREEQFKVPPAFASGGFSMHKKEKIGDNFDPFVSEYFKSQAICSFYDYSRRLFAVGFDSGTLIINKVNLQTENENEVFEEIFNTRLHQKRIMGIYIQAKTDRIFTISEDCSLKVHSMLDYSIIFGIF